MKSRAAFLTLIIIISTVALAPLAEAATRHQGKKASAKLSKPLQKSLRNGGTLQYYVQEVTAENGKASLVPRGNVGVQLTAVSPKSICRDGDPQTKRPVVFQRQGKVVFKGATDGKHGDNLGRIHIDRCSAGKYTASIATSANYEVVGAASRKVRIKKGSKLTVKFRVRKKGTPSTPAVAVQQPIDITPTPAPVPLPSTPAANPAPVVTTSPALQGELLDTTGLFEADVIPFSKYDVLDADLGVTPAIRKQNFAKNAANYFTPALIAKVNTTLAGDPFPLLGIGQLTIRNYQTYGIEGDPVIANGDNTKATVQHNYTATHRVGTLAPDVHKTWNYILVRSGDKWLIDSIIVN